MRRSAERSMVASVVFAFVLLVEWALVASEKWAEAASPGERSALIAFQSFRGDFDNEQVFVVNPDGSGVRRPAAPGFNLHREWAPNSKKIAFRSSDSDIKYESEIFLVNADGSGLANLTESIQVDETWPSWYPYGLRIAYAAAPMDPEDPHARLLAITRSSPSPWTARATPPAPRSSSPTTASANTQLREPRRPEARLHAPVRRVRCGLRDLRDRSQPARGAFQPGDQAHRQRRHGRGFLPGRHQAGLRLHRRRGRPRDRRLGDERGGKLGQEEPHQGHRGSAILRRRVPAWFPTRAKIAFTRGGSIWRMSADGTREVRVTSRGGNSPSWQPIR